MTNRAFWKGKRVFVTGHTGFKGSWLSLWLHEMGAVVQGYALEPPTIPNLFAELNLASKIASEQADVCNYEHLYACMSNFKPEIVFHLAAQSLVRASYVSPMETYRTNIMGTVSLFETIRNVESVRAVVNVTSDKCYENQEWFWGYRETEPMGGFDPYSSSKGCAELITSCYRRSFFNADNFKQPRCAVASARAGNVIGGGDWALDRLLPDILKSCANQQTVIIRHPNAIRPWQHVLEPLSGYLLLAERLYEQGSSYAEAWNFGPKEESVQTVQWITNDVVLQWGEGAKWQFDESPVFHEANFLKLDCSKAQMRLSWQPVWDLKNTLRRTVAWYKAWLAGTNMYDYTINEINTYTQDSQGSL